MTTPTPRDTLVDVIADHWYSDDIGGMADAILAAGWAPTSNEATDGYQPRGAAENHPPATPTPPSTARGDHPHTDPGDGRTECDRCGKWVFEATHSCKGVPVTDAAMARMTHDCETCTDCGHDGLNCCGCYDGACCKARP